MTIKDIEKIDIPSELSRIRSKNDREHQRRVIEIYEKLPSIKRIDSEISSLSAREAKNRIMGGAPDPSLEDSLSALSHDKEIILESNGYPADYLEPIYDCALCQDIGYHDGVMCSCARRIRIGELYKRSNLDKTLELENFSTFSLDKYSKEVDDSVGSSPYQNASKILKDAKRFVKYFDTSHGNIVIYGDTGLGKTFLSNCIAKELLDSAHSVLYLSANELFEHVLGSYIMSKDKSRALEDIYRYVYDCELLIIDDLGTEVLSSFVKSQLFEIVNKRLLGSVSTIITTNLELDTLQDRYTDRVMSRLAQSYLFYPLFGEDIRYKR